MKSAFLSGMEESTFARCSSISAFGSSIDPCLAGGSPMKRASGLSCRIFRHLKGKLWLRFGRKFAVTHANTA